MRMAGLYSLKLDISQQRWIFCRQFGCNVCGEGGEYETLTLDCRLFTHARIILKDWSMQLHSPGDLASVGVLHPLDFLLEPKGYSGGLQRQSEPSDSPQNTLNLRKGAAVNGEVQGAANRELSGRVLMVPENFQAREAPSSSITCSSETAEQSCIHYMEYRGFLSILAWWGGPSNDSAEAGFDEEAFCAILTSLGNSEPPKLKYLVGQIRIFLHTFFSSNLPTVYLLLFFHYCLQNEMTS